MNTSSTLTPVGPAAVENRARAEAMRARMAARGIRHVINGQEVDSVSGETFENCSPIDNRPICRVAAGDARDVDRAAQAARAAFPAWRDLPAKERKRLLHRVADLIEARAEEIAILESLDTGQPIRFMRKAAARGAANFRFFADRCEQARDGQSLPTEQFLNYTLRQPIGPVGAITPWNTPFMLSTWKIAPALAAGCTVVHKPAEWSPVTASLLVTIIHEAGIPAGVVNTVHGFGETAGKPLTEHPEIRAIAFVGESVTGSAILRQGADTLKRVHFELGGKNPAVIFEDADLDRAVDGTVFMIFSLNGERCTANSRALVHRSLYDEFVARVAERARRLRVGDPLDPSTELGPLIHPEHVTKVLSYIEIGREEGATLVVGGQRLTEGPYAQGNYVSPAIFADARNDMRIAQEEIFGPVLTVIPFDDEEEALALANGVKYGLTAYVWTRDVARAHRFCQRLETGMVWVNSHNVRHLPTPFGGMKYSGIGRDGGDYSFDFYMETQNIAIALGEHPIPKLGASA
jgi:5-carboxymethyl-2-hydroxymuconic-semialdehyde dehydrogenase